MLEGEVEFTSGEEIVVAGPGTLIVAPRGARHGFRGTGSGRARVLNFHAPDAGFAAWIRSEEGLAERRSSSGVRWSFRGKDAGSVDSRSYRRDRGHSIGASSAARRHNLYSAKPS